jgi:thiol:disulfide interchange protein DsbC
MIYIFIYSKNNCIFLLRVCYNFSMRKFIVLSLITMSVITFAIVRTSFSADKCDHNCMQCHKISNEDAVNLIKENVPDVKVLEIRPAEVKGLWEFTIETKGQKGIVYVDFSKKYVISGSIFDIKNKSNLTQERFSEINKVDVSQIPLNDALVLGDKDAKFRVIVFDDPA